MKFVLIFILTIAAFTNASNAQQPGAGCEYRGTWSRPVLPYRVYQTGVLSYQSHPSYAYSNNSSLPIKDGCYRWKVTGSYGSCYVFDGFNHYPGYAGVMNTVECPLDNYLPLLMIGTSLIAFLIIKKPIA